MTRGDVPDWAIERARQLCDEEAYRTPSLCPMDRAFAHYIAQHEEPPVDPFLAATREALGAWAEHTWGKGNSFAAEYRSGVLDGDSNFQLAATALRRGMELAKERQP